MWYFCNILISLLDTIRRSKWQPFALAIILLWRKPPRYFPKDFVTSQEEFFRMWPNNEKKKKKVPLKDGSKNSHNLIIGFSFSFLSLFLSFWIIFYTLFSRYGDSECDGSSPEPETLNGVSGCMTGSDIVRVDFR